MAAGTGRCLVRASQRARGRERPATNDQRPTTVLACPLGSFPSRPAGDTVLPMAHFPKPHSSQRAPRHHVPIATQIEIVYDDGRQVRGTLQVVSDTGGCAGIEALLRPATLVSIRVRTTAGPINAIAEMLRPLSATRQAFRFIAMDEADRTRLKRFVEP